jgi:hypothetical protein
MELRRLAIREMRDDKELPVLETMLSAVFYMTPFFESKRR